MEITGWPRHQLRAQGRLRSDPRIGYRKVGGSTTANHARLQPRRTDKNDSETRSVQLLNFLSKTAKDAERALLEPAMVPDFALVKNSIKAEFDVNDLVAQKRKSMVPDYSFNTPAPRPTVAPEGLLGMLADTIADAAMGGSADSLSIDLSSSSEPSVSHAAAIASAANVTTGNPMAAVSPVGSAPNAVTQNAYAELDRIFQFADPTLDGDGVSIDSISICNLGSKSEVELNEWFNCTFDPTDGDRDISFSPEAPRCATLLPAALPPVEPLVDADFEFPTADLSLSVSTALRKRTTRVRRNRGKLFKRLVIDQPRIAELPGGERLERFDNGAELKKDALGRVRHIRSGLGVSIAIAYDSEGLPQSFVRADRHGQMHSIGERDQHGVVVRDLEGRVRAAGESMFVDPHGCLSLRRVDGQFWSLDLVKELHIERRSIIGKNGQWNFLTAVFTSDGFRMMTRFQELQDDHGPVTDRFHWLAAEPSGTFRFYGRDGSVIEFEGEDHLTALKPQQVWAPGSRFIDPVFRGHHQAGTAWDSVQEYVTSYLSA